MFFLPITPCPKGPRLVCFRPSSPPSTCLVGHLEPEEEGGGHITGIVYFSPNQTMAPCVFIYKLRRGRRGW